MPLQQVKHELTDEQFDEIIADLAPKRPVDYDFQLARYVHTHYEIYLSIDIYVSSNYLETCMKPYINGGYSQNSFFSFI